MSQEKIDYDNTALVHKLLAGPQRSYARTVFEYITIFVILSSSKSVQTSIKTASMSWHSKLFEKKLASLFQRLANIMAHFVLGYTFVRKHFAFSGVGK